MNEELVESYGLPRTRMLAIPYQIVSGGLDACLQTIRAHSLPFNWSLRCQD